MAISTSVGFSKKLLTGTTSAAELFDGGKIRIYSGAAIPADASAALGTVVIEWEITKTNGTPSGLTFNAGSTGSRALINKAGDTWGGTIPYVNGGTPAPAKFFRLLESGDDGVAEDLDGDYARIQGTVGLASDSPTPDFIVASTTFVAGTKNLSAFSMLIP